MTIVNCNNSDFLIGKMSSSKLNQLKESLNETCLNKDLLTVYNEADKDNNGFITDEEALIWLKNNIKKGQYKVNVFLWFKKDITNISDKTVKRVLKLFNKNKSNDIERSMIEFNDLMNNAKDLGINCDLKTVFDLSITLLDTTA